MYDYMKGLVTDIKPEGITLEVNNIGYFINVANPYNFEINKNTIVYLHQQIKEKMNIIFLDLKLKKKKVYS